MEDPLSQQDSCDVMCLLFLLLGDPTTTSQINHAQRLILSYECLAFAWFVSWQFSLSCIIPSLWAIPVLFCKSPFYSVTDLVTGPWCAPLLVLLLAPWSLFQLSPSTYILCLPEMLNLAPVLLLTIQHFMMTITCVRQARNHSFSELNKCIINKNHKP